jgi:hypothetical protein
MMKVTDRDMFVDGDRVHDRCMTGAYCCIPPLQHTLATHPLQHTNTPTHTALSLQFTANPSCHSPASPEALVALYTYAAGPACGPCTPGAALRSRSMQCPCGGPCDLCSHRSSSRGRRVSKASEHAADLGDARVTSSRNKITVFVNAPWMLHAIEHRCGSSLWLELCRWSPVSSALTRRNSRRCQGHSFAAAAARPQLLLHC